MPVDPQQSPPNEYRRGRRLCAKCRQPYPTWAWVDGKRKSLQHRKYCLTCSPFGSHNTRKLEQVRRSAEGGILCRKCGKPLTAAQTKGRVCWSCYFGKRSEQRLDYAYGIVGQTCWRCGYTKGKRGPRLLDFHHVDPEAKLFGLDARRIVNLSWERVWPEMRKCVLLCANCHREFDAGLVPPLEVLLIHKTCWTMIDAGQAMPDAATSDTSPLLFPDDALPQPRKRRSYFRTPGHAPTQS